jgi:DNA (cytosine-5)-methyltransferase 1
MKVLNNYCGLGGNRDKWPDNIHVTAVEHNAEIAALYQERYPNDTVIVGDAHEYLLKHYKEFDFVWTSTPCPTHSRARFWASKGGMSDVVYPDWRLWQEIIFLKHFCENPFVVENVIPYYDAFIEPTIELERHCFWSNFQIKPFEFAKIARDHTKITSSTVLYGFDISKNKIAHRKDQLLRNLVNPELGLYIFEQAQGIARQEKTNQIKMFE